MNLRLHVLHQLAGGVATISPNQRIHTVSAQRLFFDVLRLAESVGIKEEHVAQTQLHLLSLIVPFGQCTKGKIRLHVNGQ